MVGRSYGGGLLKLEPKEADALPVPAPATLREAAPRLQAIRAQVAALAAADAPAAIALVDRAVLSEGLGLADEQIEALRLARSLLSQRRRARGRPHARS
jgi:hypothetical protein